MAAQLEQQLDVEAELVVGNPGEFTVWVEDRLVAEKLGAGFPEPDDVIDAVRDVMRTYDDS